MLWKKQKGCISVGRKGPPNLTPTFRSDEGYEAKTQEPGKLEVAAGDWDGERTTNQVNRSCFLADLVGNLSNGETRESSWFGILVRVHCMPVLCIEVVFLGHALLRPREQTDGTLQIALPCPVVVSGGVCV